jgi:putative DNA primase/helicase
MKTVERAQGRWREILPRLGIDRRYLHNKNGPCPCCGGKDRFRFDDKDGSGSYYCNQCGPSYGHGAGLRLVMKFNGWNFKTACDAIDQIIGTVAPKAKSKPKHPDEWRWCSQSIERVVRDAIDPDVVSAYLTKRGLSVTSPSLLGHPSCEYFDHAGNLLGSFPAVIAPILSPTGVRQSVHRIYDGDVEPRKKTMRPIETIAGCAVRLFEPTDELGIAEGVETALAAHQLFRVSVWSALTANGIESFEPPPTIKRLIIFGDNDRNARGQKAAYTLANRLSQTMHVDVRVPPLPGTDWLDVLTSSPL